MSVGWEIERRWLVRVRPGLREELGEGRPLRQGYIRGKGPSVRIRTGEARGAVLACKRGHGIRRMEAEVVVPPEMAELLFQAAGERVLEKTRYEVGPWELDWFEGDLEGLTLLEIELEDEDQRLPDPPEGVEKVREVTEDNSFTSSALASLASGERRALVARIYAEAGEERAAASDASGPGKEGP